MKPCKHLDYTEGKFTDCVIKCDPRAPDVRYWERGETWRTPPGDPHPNPINVQFCGAGRGRINGIFQCYNGEMHCYEPEAPATSGESTRHA